MRKELALLTILIMVLACISAVSYHVQPVKALYNVVEIDINADGSVTPADAPVTNVNNTFYTLTDDVNITSWSGYSSAGIRIKRNNITFNGNGHIITGYGGNGIVADTFQNVTIENTTVWGFGTCLWLKGSQFIVRGNTLYGNRGGTVFQLGGTDHLVDGNSITNGNYGFGMGYGPNNCTFTNNYFGNNTFWAITLSLGAGGCHFYHNVISGSVINDGPDSTWDNGYPSGGNYWSSSNYKSPDLFSGPYQNITGADGIGDNPYQVSYRTNIDHYPFMMVNICNVSQTPSRDSVTGTDAVEVNATVTHYFPLEQVILNCTHTNSTATWTNIINMTNLEDDIWNGIIPASPVSTNVTYVIIAQDNAGSSISSISQGYTFDYPVVIPEFPTIALLPILFAITLFVALFQRRKRTK